MRTIQFRFGNPGVKKTVLFAVKAVLALIILASCAMGIQILRLDRSLGLDEAMLAESILTRGFYDMTASKLSGNQTAPVLYLYSVKALTALFGGSEAVLRLFSYLSFCGVLALLLPPLLPPQAASSAKAALAAAIWVARNSVRCLGP